MTVDEDDNDKIEYYYITRAGKRVNISEVVFTSKYEETVKSGNLKFKKYKAKKSKSKKKSNGKKSVKKNSKGRVVVIGGKRYIVGEKTTKKSKSKKSVKKSKSKKSIKKSKSKKSVKKSY
jgi:hypothetical protein